MLRSGHAWMSKMVKGWIFLRADIYQAFSGLQGLGKWLLMLAYKVRFLRHVQLLSHIL